MNQILLLAVTTWREAWSKRLVLTVLLLSLAFVALFLYGTQVLQWRLAARAAEVGGESVGRSGQIAQASLVLFGLYIVNFLGALLGALAAVGAISSEIEGGTMLSLAPKPVTRTQIVLGKWLGFALIAVLYVILLSGTLILGVRLLTGYTPPHPIEAIALMALTSLMLLTLTVLGSSVLSTLANGVTVFLLYGIAWIGGILITIGQATDTPVMVQIGQATQIIQPSDALWKAASYHLQPEFLLELQRRSRGVSNPFLGGDPPSPGLVLWVVAYTALALLIATRVFNKRDL